MGIKFLNKYLQQSCGDSAIKKTHLAELSGKKIVIDTSIYLYRFAGDETLLENFYLMISIFRQYNIIPLFVFDGKPPKEKYDLLQQRKNEKKEAEEKYKELENTIDDEMTSKEISELKQKMDLLKKDFIRIHHTDIQNVKILMQSYGVSYIDAPGEADKLCAKLVSKNKAYACLSEDMDLFVYGCNRVMRYLSLLKKTVIMYDLKEILNDIKLTHEELKNICIVSGTDYNKNNVSLTQMFKYFKKYKKTDENDFYTWLLNNTKIIDNIEDLYVITELFDLNNMEEYKPYENIKISNGPINRANLITIMRKENFIFIPW